MPTLVRKAKFAIAAPVVNAALATFPSLSRKAPPWRAINISGSGDAYIENSEKTADQLVRAGLTDGQTIVEIGMGMGGNAVALWKRFGDRIAYKGFDIVRFAITWTRQHFAHLGGTYEFTHADVYNSFYNPFGRAAPSEYAFPYEAGSADLVFANSVFTHMQEREVEHYMRETTRILRPGGLAWFSFFILDPDSESQLAAMKTDWSFDHQSGVARVHNDREPDHAVAYPEAWIRSALHSAGLTVHSISLGSWRGREADYFQDLVLARRQ